MHQEEDIVAVTVMVAVLVVATGTAAAEEDSAKRVAKTRKTIPMTSDAASAAACWDISEPTALTGNEPFRYMIRTPAHQRSDRIPAMRQSQSGTLMMTPCNYLTTHCGGLGVGLQRYLEREEGEKKRKKKVERDAQARRSGGCNARQPGDCRRRKERNALRSGGCMW